MAGAGAGGGNNPNQEKAGFFSASQPFTFNEEHLAAKVEEEKRLSEWREGEGREAAHNTLWTTFQQTAAALTQLYRQQESGVQTGQAGPGGGVAEAEAGPGGGSREWQPFQAAAGQLTMLYRDSLEEMRKANDAGRRSGYQKARSDLVTWIRSRRGRNISRAELLAFLARSQDQEPEVGRQESVPPGADPATQHALLQMFENSREEPGEERGRKRGGPGDPDNESESEEMESPQSKRSRFL